MFKLVALVQIINLVTNVWCDQRRNWIVKDAAYLQSDGYEADSYKVWHKNIDQWKS